MTAMHESELLREFKRLLAQPDDELELDRGSLLIAKVFQPDLDIETYLHRLDLMAEHAAVRLRDIIGSRQSIAALNQYLFEDERFRGNTDAYYDPRNSFLNEVLDRRAGIPVTLSVIYMELGRRLGFALEGVGFPGHFIIKHPGPEKDIFIDPFNHGAVLTEVDFEARLRAMYGQEADLDERFLAAVPRRRILSRMLTNLKAIFLHAGEKLHAIKVIDLSLCVDPDNAEDLRNRGLLYLELECFRLAWQDLEKYLEVCPDADDAPQVTKALEVAREQALLIN